jgi:sigma-B regulation protein RsbU (phosphoserine phosphatase)
LILGKFTEIGFEAGTAFLRTGDTLLLYTDGITEAPDADGRFFGDDADGLRTLLGSTAGLPLPDAAAKVMSAVESYSAGIPQSDDRTLMLIRLLRSAGEGGPS